MRKINKFDDVKVLSNKDIYERIGKRAPKMPKTSDIALFGLSKVDSIAYGEHLVNESFNEQEKASSLSGEVINAIDEVKEEDATE